MSICFDFGLGRLGTRRGVLANHSLCNVSVYTMSDLCKASSAHSLSFSLSYNTDHSLQPIGI